MDDLEKLIKESVDSIEPEEGAKERMFANIMKKAGNEPKPEGTATVSNAIRVAPDPEKKNVSGTKRVSNITVINRFAKWALPAAAAIIVIALAIRFLPGLLGRTPIVDDPVTTGIPDYTSPFVDYENAGQLLAAFGFSVDAPEGAVDPGYYGADKVVAGVNFTYGEHYYKFEATKIGTYFAEEYKNTGEGTSSIVKVDASTDASLETVTYEDYYESMLTWTDGVIFYMLYNADSVEKSEILDMYEKVRVLTKVK